jgi:Ca2+-binding RTX toxin-like protein
MASVTFTGDVSASNGTSLQGMYDVTQLTAALVGGPAAEGDRIESLIGQNDGIDASSETVDMNMVTLGDDREIVTGLTSSGGTPGGSSVIVTIAGLRITADFDNVATFSAENLLEYQRVINAALAGDDDFFLSGAISRIWGDFQTAPTQGTVRMGDDIFAFTGSVTAPLGAVTIYGDAQAVPAGANVVAGNDVLDLGAFFNVSCVFFGDFEIASGQVTYGNDHLFGGSLADTLHGDSQDAGNAGGNDFLVGYDGEDHLLGEGGNDRLRGGGDADQMNGGAGADTADYRGAGLPLTVVMVADLADPTQNTNEGAGDTYTSIENLMGRNYADFGDDLRGNGRNNSLFGFDGDDVLTANGGKDRLSGGLGADVIDGGPGSDSLTGGTGEDHFVFSAVLNVRSNVDKITDFTPNDDTIQLSRTVMAALPAIGTLPGSAFFASKTGAAHDENDRILYEKDTGKVFYDTDGDGSAGASLFAILQKQPVVTAADFEIIA